MITSDPKMATKDADAVADSTAPLAGAEPGEAERAWASSNLPEGAEVVGVVCGSDAGLATAERLQAALMSR